VRNLRAMRKLVRTVLSAADAVVRSTWKSLPSPESFCVIRALERMKTPQAKELLQVISEGPASLRSTREATKALEHIK
jgi:hypothetical protein